MKYALLFALTACGSSNPLVGTWTATYAATVATPGGAASPGGSSSVQFNDGGTTEWNSELNYPMASLVHRLCKVTKRMTGTFTEGPNTITVTLSGVDTTTGCREPSENRNASTITYEATLDYVLTEGKLTLSGNTAPPELMLPFTR